MGDLHLEVKQMIIDSLELEDIEPADIVDHEALFVEGLGLDSIDALEIGLVLQSRYGIILKADSDETRQYFTSVNTLVALIESQRSR